MVSVPLRSTGAGIPSQYDDVITAVDIALITGNEPAVLTEDMQYAASQTILAWTAVGLDASNNIIPATSTVEASGALTFSGVGTADDTVTIDGVVYTLKAAPTTVAGQVKIGATAAATAANLAAAINGGDGAGTLYGSLTTAHPSVIASVAGAVLTATARVGGTAGNSIGTTESGTSTAWGASTLAGGTATPTSRAIGITVVDVTTGASGNLKSAPIYRAGCFNPDAIAFHASYTSEAEKINAFRGAPTPTNIILRKPKTMSVTLP